MAMMLGGAAVRTPEVWGGCVRQGRKGSKWCLPRGGGATEQSMGEGSRN